MKKHLLAALFAFINYVGYCNAEDLGKIAQTYPIKENDLSEVFKKRVAKAVDSGAWAKAMKEEEKKLQQHVDTPEGIVLPKANMYRSRYFDPSIILDRDILDHKGKVIARKGTKINPLDTISYNKALCFFDATDQKQIQWISKMCLDLTNSKAIAVRGPIMKVMQDLDARLFFDQYGNLTKHFGIKALPSLVRQTGNVFVIEEFSL